MEEERRKGKRNEKHLGIFLLIMIILFIGIACVISYIAGCIVTERKYIQKNIVQELTKQQEKKYNQKLEEIIKYYDKLVDDYIEDEYLENYGYQKWRTRDGRL